MQGKPYLCEGFEISRSLASASCPSQRVPKFNIRAKFIANHEIHQECLLQALLLEIQGIFCDLQRISFEYRTSALFSSFLKFWILTLKSYLVLNPPFWLQKRVLCRIKFEIFSAHTAPILQSLKILKLEANLHLNQGGKDGRRNARWCCLRCDMRHRFCGHSNGGTIIRFA